MKPPRPVHLEIQTHRANPVGVLRSSYRQDGHIKHENHGRITSLSLDQLKLIQAAFRQGGHSPQLAQLVQDPPIQRVLGQLSPPPAGQAGGTGPGHLFAP